MATASDSSDEDEVVVNKRVTTTTREQIRKQLAASNSSSNSSRDTNLLVCFMNEALTDDEDDDEEDFNDDDDDQLGGQKKGGGRRDGNQERHELLTLDQLSARYIARNNISTKKNHVIVPLTPKSEDRSILEQEAAVEEKTATVLGRGSPELTDAESCALYLKEIQLQAREKLKLAKFEAREAVQSEGESRVLSRDLDKLIGTRRRQKPVATTGGKKLNRRLLTEMNVAQLQVILNYLLSRIEDLNERLVEFLMERDELVMEQDSLLTDIEDITKGIDI
jgi:hypothetical protein